MVSNIYITGVIGKYIDSQGNPKNGVTVQSAMNQYHPLCDSISVIINSEGGAVEEGFAIRQYLQSLGKPIETIIDGLCASIATVIALSAPIENRKMSAKSVYMIHNAYGDNITCDAQCFREVADQLDSINDRLIALYSKETGKPEAEIKRYMDKESYFDFQTAKNLGFVSEKIEGVNRHNYEYAKVKNKVVTYFNMEKVVEKKKGVAVQMLEDFGNTLKSLVGAVKKISLKNMLTVTLSSGGDLVIDSEDGEIEGKSVMTADGASVSAGTYELTDGRTITVGENSTVESVAVAQAEASSEAEAEPVAEASAEAKMEAVLAKMFDTQFGESMKQLSALAKALETPTKNFSVIPKGCGNKQMTNHRLDKFAGALQNRIAQSRPDVWKFKNASVVVSDFDYTYDGQLSTDLIYKPSLRVPLIEKLFRVETGIYSKKQLLLTGNLSDKILKAYQGCKGMTLTSDEQASIFNRTLEVTKMEVLLEQCADIFDDTILEEWAKLGIESENLTGTQLETVVLTLVKDALSRAVFRVCSFGDTGDGDADWNQIDGIWKRLIDASTDVSEFGYCSQAFEITSLTSANVYAKLKEMFDTSSLLLRQMPANEKMFFVTPNIFDAYLAYLESTAGLGTESGLRMIQDGVIKLYFRGVEVVPIFKWEQDLDDATNPFYGDFNSAILYTTPKNHVIGVGLPTGKEVTEMWYSKDDNVNRIKSLPRFGYNFVHCDLNSYAIGQV